REVRSTRASRSQSPRTTVSRPLTSLAGPARQRGTGDSPRGTRPKYGRTSPNTLPSSTKRSARPARNPPAPPPPPRPPPPSATRTPPTLPSAVVVYCEAAWAGAFTRLSIDKKLFDFASPPTDDPTKLTPDPTLDKYFVLTYYLFYPGTEPPPSTSSPTVASPDQFFREGQCQAVSL